MTKHVRQPGHQCIFFYAFICTHLQLVCELVRRQTVRQRLQILQMRDTLGQHPEHRVELCALQQLRCLRVRRNDHFVHVYALTIIRENVTLEIEVLLNDESVSYAELIVLALVASGREYVNLPAARVWRGIPQVCTHTRITAE